MKTSRWLPTKMTLAIPAICLAFLAAGPLGTTPAVATEAGGATGGTGLLASVLASDAQESSAGDGNAAKTATATDATAKSDTTSSARTSSPTVQTQGDYSYTVDSTDGTATITAYTGSATELAVPDQLDGKAVTSIAAGAFSGNAQLASVSIPSSVTSIGDRAFADCPALSYVELSEGLVSLGGGAFLNDVSLSGITLPSTFTTCGTVTVAAADGTQTVMGPFGGCAGLSTVAFAKGTTAVPANLLAGCTSTKVTLAIPDSVTTIDPAATGPQWTVILAHPGTAAEAYATQYGHEFVDSTIRATSVTLDKEAFSLKRGEETGSLTMALEPADCEEQIVWSVSDPSLASIAVSDDKRSATVSTATGLGTATVTVTVGSHSASCDVTVWQPVKSINLNRSSFAMEAREVRQLVAQALPEDATNKQVTWSSSNPAVASVDAQTGLVTGVSAGTATITATAADGAGAWQSCTVTVTSNAYTVNDPSALATPHPYANSCSDTWTYTLAGAKALNVTFDARTSVENTFDTIEVYDKWGNRVGVYTGTALSGETVSVNGDSVTVKIVSDEQVGDWGFAVTAVTAIDPNPDGWRVVDGTTYYYKDGAVYKGLLQLDDGWHYFDVNTGAMVIGLVTLPDGRLVYFNANGVMMTGDVMLSDGWHYFDPETGAMVLPDPVPTPVPTPTPDPSNPWNLVVSDSGQVTSDFFSFTLPSYWVGKVDVSYVKTDTDGYVAVTLKDNPSQLIASIGVYDAGTYQDTEGDLSSSRVGKWNDGRGHIIDMWYHRGLMVLWYAGVDAFPSADIAAQMVDLLSLGTVSVDDVLAAANEAAVYQMGLDAETILVNNVAVALYNETGSVVGVATNEQEAPIVPVVPDEPTEPQENDVPAADAPAVEEPAADAIVSPTSVEEPAAPSEPEAVEPALSLDNANQRTAVNLLLNTVAWAFPGTSADLSSGVFDTSQTEQLARFAANALIQSGDDAVEQFGSDEGASDFGSFGTRVDATRIVQTVSDIFGISLDLGVIASEQMYYDGSYLYIDTTVPVYTNNVALQAASIEQAEDGTFNVAVSIYTPAPATDGSELTPLAETLDRNVETDAALTDQIDAFIADPAATDGTVRVGKATVKLATDDDGAQHIYLVSFDLAG